MDFETWEISAVFYAGFVQEICQIVSYIVVAYIIVVNKDSLFLSLTQIPNKNIQIIEVIMAQFHFLLSIAEVILHPILHRQQLF